MVGRLGPAIPRDLKRTCAMPDNASPSLLQSFDDPLGRKIIELHVWAVGEGLRGTEVAPLFDALCQRLVIAGVPLRRAFAGMRTLHPQWGGYAYTWWRDSGIERPAQFARGNRYEQNVQASVFGHLRRQADERGKESRPLLHLRRRLVGSEALLDFPPLEGRAIRINVLSPGHVETPGPVRPDVGGAESGGRGSGPIGPIGTPNDVGKAAVF